MRKNRQEKVIISKIEKILDDEFSKYQENLKQQINMMNKAIERSKCELLSEEDTKEINKLYRKIVKKLHPDIHPEINYALENLFQNAITAYENGDLDTLKIIDEMVGDHPLPDNKEDVMSHLSKEKSRLQNLIKRTNERIEKIKSEFPYIVKEIIEDPKKTGERRSQIEAMYRDYNTSIEIYIKVYLHK